MITTKRLLIRRFEAGDGDWLYEYLSDPAVYRYEPGSPVTLEEARELARERAAGEAFWAVALKESGRLVGHLYFTQIAPKRLLTWELGYIFNPAFQNRGYATESARALICHGFRKWSIHRVVAHCNPQNTASWRVLEKIGMRREGYFRKNVFFRRDGEGRPLWNDSLEYAILEEEVGR